MKVSSPPRQPPLVIGLDVGGTNTDAVLLHGNHVIASAKVPTTRTVTNRNDKNNTIINDYSAIQQAIRSLQFENSSISISNNNNNNEKQDVTSLLPNVQAVFLGTTIFVNALLEGKGLDKVVVIRLCGPSSRSLPPFSDFPSVLYNIICGGYYFTSGGIRFDGSIECNINETELKNIANEINNNKKYNIRTIIISGIFSPIDPSQEEHAKEILQKYLHNNNNTNIILSSNCGPLGLLARENSAILTGCLIPIAYHAAKSAQIALRELVPTDTKLYFTANDGSVLSFPQAMKAPLRCVACGPTNSLRGAAFLIDNGNKNNQTTTTTNVDDNDNNEKLLLQQQLDRIVLDIGGTSTDAGCLLHGLHPRDSNSESYVAGIIRCNHRITDVVSIALGGGSIVREICNDNDEQTTVQIGPDSVGADITSKALCFGGTICTATCIAIAMGVNILNNNNNGPPNSVVVPTKDFTVPSYAEKAWDIMQQKFYDLVQKTRTNSDPVEVVLVGGGADLVDSNRLSNALNNCQVIRPKHYHVANACGSALAQAVGEADTIVNLDPNNRDTIITDIQSKAKMRAGPNAKIIECEQVPLAYLPGNVTRVFARAVAPLDITTMEEVNNENNVDDELMETPYIIQEEEKTCNSQSSEKESALPKQENLVTVKPSSPIVKDGVWTISVYDAHCLAVGCGILGCGGGGSTFHGHLQLLAALKDGQPIRVVSVDSIPDESLVIPCGFMGAPSVSLENIGSPDQLVAAVRQNLEAFSRVRDGPRFITLSEVGGTNGIIPLLVAGMMDIPVVDADLMGRAFPELQMMTTSIYGLSQFPSTLSDSYGRCLTIQNNTNRHSGASVPADELYWNERVFRPVCVEFGCFAGLADPPLSGPELRCVGVLGSLSRARRIGDCILQCQHPVDAIETMLQNEGGKCIFRGRISDVQRETTSGFAKGSLRIDAEDHTGVLTIQFQNEYLIAQKIYTESNQQELLGCVPDIISILDEDNARPIATEEVRFGTCVFVILLPVPEILRTEEALSVVGPDAFGLGVEYKSDIYNIEGVVTVNNTSIANE